MSLDDPDSAPNAELSVQAQTQDTGQEITIEDSPEILNEVNVEESTLTEVIVQGDPPDYYLSCSAHSQNLSKRFEEMDTNLRRAFSDNDLDRIDKSETPKTFVVADVTVHANSNHCTIEETDVL